MIGASGVVAESPKTVSMSVSLTPRISAAIWGNTVVAPSPTSISPLIREILPDLATLTVAAEVEPGPPR